MDPRWHVGGRVSDLLQGEAFGTHGANDEGGDPVTWPIGGYGQHESHWRGKCPTGDIANLDGHDIEIHPDGTITVSPSIAISMRVDGEDLMLWHGYLERGVWRTLESRHDEGN